MRIPITLFLFSIVHCAFAQRTNELLKVDSIIQTFNQTAAPGFSIGIVENGKLIYTKGVGLANIEAGTTNSTTTLFGVASIAKQMTAACIWSLIKADKISLNDDVRKYLPELPSYGKPILVRHMLNHTSGLRNYHTIMELAGFDYDKKFHDNQTILQIACRQKALNNIPGEKVIYGNTSYTVLAIIIERISGLNLNEYAQQHIFKPLGMNDTFYRIDHTSIIQNRSIGYVLNENRFEIVTSHQNSYGAGSVGSTINDLAIWSNILNGLNSEYLDLTTFLTTTETLHSGKRAQYARGVMVDSYKNNPTVHHSGYGLGGQSQILAVPELRIAVIILTNLESIDPSPLSYNILDLFLPTQNADQQKATTPFHHKKRALRKFVGQYKEQNSDMKMEIILENDTLKALGSQGKKPIPLESLERGKFTRSSNSSVLYDFTSAKKTQVSMMVYFGGTPFYFSRAKFIEPATVDLNAYVGHYYSDELDVEYEIVLENNSLVVNHHSKSKLIPGQKDEFGNGQRVLYQFVRNEKKEVVKLFLSAEGTVKNIAFNKK